MLNSHFTLLTILFLVLGFIYNQNTFLILGLISLFIMFLGNIWIKAGQKSLRVIVTTEKVAEFQDNSFNVTYTIENRSILPFSNLKLYTAFHRNITVTGLKTKQNEGFYNYYQLNFSLSSKSKISQTIQCNSKNRGNYFVADTSLFLTDPFFIYESRIDGFENKEMAIYPKIFNLELFKEFFNQLYGNKRVRYSMLEDRILPKGAREYTSTDAFNKIDWKQSSRNNQLYTKEFEYTSHQDYWILANLKTNIDGYGESEEKTEKIISTVASIAYLLSKNNISYNILLNARLAKTNTLYKLTASKKKDLQKVMLQLAKLRSYVTVNFIHSLKNVKNDIGPNKPIVIIVSYYLSNDVLKQIAVLKRDSYKIIWIDPSIEKVEDSIDEILDFSNKSIS